MRPEVDHLDWGSGAVDCWEYWCSIDWSVDHRRNGKDEPGMEIFHQIKKKKRRKSGRESEACEQEERAVLRTGAVSVVVSFRSTRARPLKDDFRLGMDTGGHRSQHWRRCPPHQIYEPPTPSNTD
ncbi:hypothetical protein AAG570_011801 [Ranatra chinensis]|uniref:Uncharacterized protein n=1 Tax=Ranatra chinensis TaxID=642074 RepID=A0ABD0YH63_9HEMI